MNDTPASLLERLRHPDDAAAWKRFVQLYAPLLYHWARRRMGLQTQDATDLVQESGLAVPDLARPPPMFNQRRAVQVQQSDVKTAGFRSRDEQAGRFVQRKVILNSVPQGV